MKKTNNTVRIIAGSLRGRRVSFPVHDGLRPTGDRLRETLFSWLQDSLPGRHCLDMFAGSGVLGFESISRGAEQAVLLEQSRAVCRVLHENAGALAIENLTIGCTSSLQIGALQQFCAQGSVDIAFIDPPFAARLQQSAIDVLSQSGILAPGARVAVESSKHDGKSSVPASWLVLREKLAGDVRLVLYRMGD